MRQGFLLLFLLIGAQLQAQNLMVQQEAGRLYLSHTVAAKENWYSIGRIYKISPREIAPFNGTTIEKGLSIGQKLKVPLTDVNLAQSGQPDPDEVFVPLYHVAKAQEGLYRIGQTYNKVSADQIKAWNRLKSDQTPVGTNLVVGYLRVKRDLSPLAAQGLTNVQNSPAAKPAAPTAATTTAPAAQTTVAPAPLPAPKTTPPAEKESARPAATTQPAVAESKPAVTPAAQTAAAPPAKETAASATTPTSAPSTKAAPQPASTSLPSSAEGAFSGLFLDQSKGRNLQVVTGQASSFKSTSGWKDGKFYVLMNEINPGTIVKVTSTASNKSVYAKVLGEIPAGKENDGLLVRLSNAALMHLQAGDGRFEVQLQY